VIHSVNAREFEQLAANLCASADIIKQEQLESGSA
jgi:hypothetical protein